ncbi:MAG: hypothetical protein EOO52_12910 [Gammaproteobacteria bacterium]|nr:MAG: hypothetical protein EOO52_12910 [Gammaproteobacteria bacterium]
MKKVRRFFHEVFGAITSLPAFGKSANMSSSYSSESVSDTTSNRTASDAALRKRQVVLASIGILSARTESISEKHQPDCWTKSTNLRFVKGILVKAGLFYYTQLRIEHPHPSLIDETLEVGPGDGNYCRQLAGYYPTYANLSPADRLAYINFLSTDRCSPGVGIGFVFLYFYGLERRLLGLGVVESPEVEKVEIIAEIERLLGLYSSNSSLERYASGLLYFVSIENGDHANYCREALDHTMRSIVAGRRAERSTFARVIPALSLLAYSGATLGLEWMYTWARHLSLLSNDEFLSVSHAPGLKAFEIAFHRVYPNGFVPFRGSIHLTITYKASAPGVGILTRTLSEITDPTQCTENILILRRLIADAVAHCHVGKPQSDNAKVSTSTIKSQHTAIPFQYQPAELQRSTNPIPTTADTPSGTSGLISLNYERLALLEKESAEVSSLLSEVFEPQPFDDFPSDDFISNRPSANDTYHYESKFAALPTLTTVQESFLNSLLKEMSWERETLQTLAQSHRLMLDGVLDRLNELCWEAFDDSLVECDGDYRINEAVANLILESAASNTNTESTKSICC